LEIGLVGFYVLVLVVRGDAWRNVLFLLMERRRRSWSSETSAAAE